MPSLKNAVWSISDAVIDVPVAEQNEIDKSLQLMIKRSRVGVEILKRPSTPKTKYDLFQRLNSGGLEANDQEVRNSIILMVNADYFRAIKAQAEMPNFLELISITDSLRDKQRHIELAVRILVYSLVDYERKMDVGEFIDESIVDLASRANLAEVSIISDVFDLLHGALGKDALKKYEDGIHSGKVGLVGIEMIAVGIARNLHEIKALASPEDFVKERIQSIWNEPEVSNFSSQGMRGTTRIQKTIPFGAAWFKP